MKPINKINPIIIDLSKGWDVKEIEKLLNALPVSDADRQVMMIQNKILSLGEEGKNV